jgi:hypothetical protein
MRLWVKTSGSIEEDSAKPFELPQKASSSSRGSKNTLPFKDTGDR